MKKPLHIAIVVVTAAVSVIAYTGLGLFLNEQGIRGPFVGSQFLTAWSNWQYVVLGLTIVTTLLVYALTRPRKG